MAIGSRGWWRVVAMTVVAGGFAWVGWWLWGVYRDRAVLADARGHIEAGRFAIAAKDLTRLLHGSPNSDEVAYLLGLCEQKLDRPRAALEVWGRIPIGSRFRAPAILGRASILVDGGRFADAEDLIDQALRDPEIIGFDLRRFLTPLLWHEGRVEEARRLVETNWDELERAGDGGSSQGIELIRLHLLMTLGKSAPERIEDFLERAGGLAPEDDRVWLGKAHLAIRKGRFDEAARWLEACLDRRPRDVAVWRARLNLAVATARVEEAQDCASHLPADPYRPGEVYRLAAWFAGRRGETRAERRALEQLIAVDPEEGFAFERLAVLLEGDREPNRASELRRRKSDLEGVLARYKERFARDQPLRDAAEMARLAEQLGRDFEARAFRVLAGEVREGGDRNRVATTGKSGDSLGVARSGETLADRLATLLTSEASTERP